MSRFTSPLLADLHARGYLYQFTDAAAIDALFCSGTPIVFYIGYDPTAPSLHVGHLLWIKLVNKLQRAGHNPLVVIGGATGKIGDPTWKDAQRKMLAYDVIESNINSINAKLARLIDFRPDNPHKALLVNNNDWLSRLNYIDFLRDFGALFSVNNILAMDSLR